MVKGTKTSKWLIYLLVTIGVFVLTSCSEYDKNDIKQEATQSSIPVTLEESKEETKENEKNQLISKEQIIDYNKEFNGISGCMVIYDTLNDIYYFYNKEQCQIPVSPLSTFKIVATIIGLENNVIENNTSTMNYNGTKYSIEQWNDNLTLAEAFQNSCVWYFRQVIDTVGKERVQENLNNLHYGDCDISEWGGSGVNPLPELNGFWLESSLNISPLEQIEVLYNLFEGKTSYSSDDLKILKDIMFVTDDENGSRIYGKTGTGYNGKAWFVGFSENNTKRKYFALYLDDSANSEVISGNRAREIAMSIIGK